jgi:hypothetical protein
MDFLGIFCCFESASSNYIQKINKEKSHEQNMDKSETGKQIKSGDFWFEDLFFRFLKSMDWYGFPMDFLLF